MAAFDDTFTTGWLYRVVGLVCWNVRPARRTLKTIERIDHCVSSQKVGISRGFSNEFARRGGPRFFRPLLYRLSYLGGALILLGPPKSRANNSVANHCATEGNGLGVITLMPAETIAHRRSL